MRPPWCSRNHATLASFGHGAEAADRHGFACLREVDHDRRDAGEVHVFALQHTQRDAAGHARIDRIAAGFKNLEPDLRGKVVRRRGHVPRADDARMMGRHAMLVGHPQSPFCGWTSAGNPCVIGLTGEPAAMSLRATVKGVNDNRCVFWSVVGCAGALKAGPFGPPPSAAFGLDLAGASGDLAEVATTASCARCTDGITRRAMLCCPA